MDTRAELNVLSICSGYGGIELGLHAALGGSTRTVCYVEHELGVASILAARMEDGSLDSAPIWTDLRSFDPEPWRGRVDLLAGGVPCQPHSVAGAQRGEDDPRELSGEVLRIAAGLGYPTLFLENVPGILRFYWDSIRPQLREMGYEVKEGLFTASETGAPHKRERLFILAHSGESGIWDQSRTPGGGTRVEDVRQGARATGTVWSSSTSPILDDSEHDGLAAPEEPRGSELRTRHGEAGEIEPEQPTGPSSGAGGDNELAHAEGISSERPLRGRDRCGQPETAAGDRGSELAHAECVERGDALGNHRRDSAEGAREGEPDRPGGRSSDVAHAGLPLYPPGPNDHAGWAYMLSIMPEALPTFCRDADGPATRVGDQLRALGNGVIPAVAATAYRELSEAIGGGRYEC